MSPQDMKETYHHDLKKPPASMAKVDELFQADMWLWLHIRGDHLDFVNHFLRLNPVKVHWSKERTRVERTADLVLRGEATSTPQAHEHGKILCRRAVMFSAEWPNG